MAHVLPPEPHLQVTLDRLPADDDRAWHATQARLVEFTHDRAFGDTPCKIALERGDLADVIPDLIREQAVDLVVLGTHGRRGVSKMVLGSGAEKIYRSATCPVLTVGPKAHELAQDWKLRRILCPVDLAEDPEPALHYALSLAEENQAEFIVMQAVPLVPWQHRASVEQQARRDLERLIPEPAKDWCVPECIVRWEHPAEAILHTATDRGCRPDRDGRAPRAGGRLVDASAVAGCLGSGQPGALSGADGTNLSWKRRTARASVAQRRQITEAIMLVNKQQALDYHFGARPGKIEVTPTKPCRTQRDLSLAYTPGVAEPCLEIEKNPHDAYKYTGRGNLVAVLSNGTAVLGLGDIGALAGKPVMEGKAVLFKRFADVDVFDIEVDSHNPDEIIKLCQLLEPTFGGINLEDIKAPDCFYIEETLRKTMKIPVFHDDQHGTAIISGAALLNALEVVGKDIRKVRVVFNGAGAAGIACAEHYVRLGVKRENIILCDTKGVVYKGRKEGMNKYKERFAVKTDRRTLAEALVGADVFAGLSVKGAITQDMVRSMAPDPIVFAMANPDPEITYEEAKAARPDVIIATGRSDYPNQVNNVLGFPFIFRGALDVRATAINEEMKLAATHALANLAKEDVPDSVCRAYGVERLQFGREYLIPKPFDPRVLMWEASAVAEAAMRTGVAQEPVDLETYRAQLERRLGKAYEVSRTMIHKAQVNPKQVVFPEGDNEKILRACHTLVDEKIANPILLGDAEKIQHPSPRAGRGSGRHADCRSGDLGPSRVLRAGTVPPAAAPGRHPGRGAHADQRPQRVWLDDGAHGRCRRAGLRRDPALSRHHPSGAADRAHARRPAPGLRLLRHDHAQGRSLLPRRHQREHRAHGRRPGRDRAVHGAHGAAFRRQPARGHAVVLQLRQRRSSHLHQGAQGGRTAELCRSHAHRRRRNHRR